MPSLILDRIPLPSLRVYTTTSILLVSACLYFAISSTSDPDWRLQNNATLSPISDTTDELATGSDTLLKVAIDGISGLENKLTTQSDLNGVEIKADELPVSSETNFEAMTAKSNATRTLSGQLTDIMSFMCQEPFCIWVSKLE